MVAEIFNIKYFEVIFRWRLPSIGGHLQLGIAFHQRLSSFQAFLILVWSPELKFEISGRSIQWLPRYSTFYILRSSSIGGRLHFEHFWFWFSPMSLSSKFEEDPISGCWNIQLLSLDNLSLNTQTDTQTDTHTHRQISDCSSSLASA